jgi:hypothetical protein
MGGFWKKLFGTEQSPEAIADERIEQSPEVIAEERIQAAYRSGALELELDKLELMDAFSR